MRISPCGRAIWRSADRDIEIKANAHARRKGLSLDAGKLEIRLVLQPEMEAQLLLIFAQQLRNLVRMPVAKRLGPAHPPGALAFLHHRWRDGFEFRQGPKRLLCGA